jgi:hypothetical protein
MRTTQKKHASATTKRRKLASLIRELPVDAIDEVSHFVDLFLPSKRSSKRKFQQLWAGGLKAHKRDFTSVGLQKTAMLWRTK